jgi:soluble lytic murein transglycosylase-like protein
MVRIGSLLALVCAAALGVGAAVGSPSERAAGLPVKRDGIAMPAEAAATAAACPIPDRYRGAFAAAADDARLPLSLLAAVTWVESRFHPSAVSPKGAVVLLQVMPVTARRFGLDEQEPAANVLAGARFLRHLLDRFRSADLALAAYNAGPAAVERAGGAPSLEVVRYVANVNAYWRAHIGCTV